ncbi:unnamed protein product [Oikopleura dioica]|uniref:Uncharacterized protein n=1 Tax=Oikopleura dioica TaxID=34765 RepID=E4Y278_OIKDI|nr:unnamed protein product [Oikopleura dioica]
MIRLSFRTFVLCLALGLVTLLYQFQNIQNESKSRRNRISMSDNPPIEESIAKNEEEAVVYNLNEAVHAFYYPWYASAEVDGQWAHWNHPVLPHWIARVNAQCKGCKSLWKMECSTYYPTLGPYSSADPKVIDQHLRWVAEAGIGTLVVSFFAKGRTDDNGLPFEHVVQLLFERAPTYKAASIADDIRSTVSTYAKHPSAAKIDGKLIFYLYDSYQVQSSDWARVIPAVNDIAYTIGLLVEFGHLEHVIASRFSAAYSYFAAIDFSFGCTPKNWKRIVSTLSKNKVEFIPSVGPGYDDTSIRPWNKQNSKSRADGEYYSKYWDEAIKLKPKIISITSFNEWHEGTQIEPAIEKSIANSRAFGDSAYPSYSNPMQYLELTARYSSLFSPST